MSNLSETRILMRIHGRLYRSPIIVKKIEGQRGLIMKSTAGKFRDGFRRYEVYNDGLLIYLYDPSNSQAILASVPEDDDYPLDEQNLGDAVKAGLIVLIRLSQDDELNVEVGQGRPLTKKEKTGFQWLPIEQAYLSLPSGVLRIDSANSLMLIPEEADEDGAEFACEPGQYRVSIERVSLDQPDDRQFEGPTHVLTLKSVSQKEFAGNDTVLVAAEGWVESNLVVEGTDGDTFYDQPPPCGRVEGDRFHGHVYFDEDESFFLNLVPSSGQELNLNYVNCDWSADIEDAADFVRITVPALGLDIHCCICGRRYFDMSKKELAAIGKNVATGLPQHCYFAGTGLEMIRFSWDANSRKIKSSEIEQWYEAILEGS